MKISKLTKKDIKGVISVASESFSGLKEKARAKKWIEGNFKCYPRMQYFTAKENGKVLGYILWLEKGGFRREAVWELEQIALTDKMRGRGIGTELILKTLPEIKKYLKKRGSVLKAIEVTTGTENKAQKLYNKTLKAEVECVVHDLFRGDEVIMIARF